MSKHVEFMPPIDYLTGNISGHQSLEYGQGGGAYEQPTGQRTAATNYEPRLIAKRLDRNKIYARSYFQVRTRTTVNMTESVRLNMAVMGGAGALFASLLRMKESEIYAQCLAAKPIELTLRQFMVPILKTGLSDKNARINITANVFIVNPWVSSDTPNVPVTQAILDKFSVLSSNL